MADVISLASERHARRFATSSGHIALSPGDVVLLTSGSYFMLVERNLEELFHCVWVGGFGKVETGWFGRGELTLVFNASLQSEYLP